MPGEIGSRESIWRGEAKRTKKDVTKNELIRISFIRDGNEISFFSLMPKAYKITKDEAKDLKFEFFDNTYELRKRSFQTARPPGAVDTVEKTEPLKKTEPIVLLPPYENYLQY